MGSDRRLLAAAFAAIAFLMAGPARAAVDRPTHRARRRRHRPVPPGPRVDAREGRRQVRGPGQRRRRHGLARARAGQGRLPHSNTRATLTQTVPNGTYYWRVRARRRGRRRSRRGRPALVQEALDAAADDPEAEPGRVTQLPGEPCRAPLDRRPGAAQYLVSVASDPRSARSSSSTRTRTTRTGRPNVAATSAAITAALAPGTYYWGVVPIDAEGNRGVATPVQPFSWVWPSATSRRSPT